MNKETRYVVYIKVLDKIGTMVVSFSLRKLQIVYAGKNIDHQKRPRVAVTLLLTRIFMSYASFNLYLIVTLSSIFFIKSALT